MPGGAIQPIIMSRSKSIFLVSIIAFLAIIGTQNGAFALDSIAVPKYQLQTLNDSDEILVETKLAYYLFSARGGLLRSVYLHFTPVYTVSAELVSDTETRLIDPETGELERSYVQTPLFPFGLTINGTDTKDVIYDCVPSETLTQMLEIICTTEVNGVRISKIYSLGEYPNFSVDFRLELENVSGSLINLDDGIQFTIGDGVGPEGDNPQKPIFLYRDELREQIFDSPSFNGLGFKDRNLIVFLKPEELASDVFPTESESDRGRISLGIDIPEISLQTGEIKSYSFLFFAGRDKFTLLDEIGLGTVNPPGFFQQFIIPIVYFLNWLYDQTGNYGWAIIIFTLLTRILLFPLFRKQAHSMARLAEVRPQMEKIQQRYPGKARLKELHPNMSEEELSKRDRENKVAMQEKIMTLYREEKVNPFGGCLPMFVQLPILLVLWQAIIYSAEAIHFTPGFLWMPDLSLKDPFLAINIVTAAVMILQTRTTPKINTGQQGPNPTVIMILMVGFMLYILRDFPSGLWFYYFLTTVVQVIQQVVINREMHRMSLATAAAGGGSTTDTDGKDDESLDIEADDDISDDESDSDALEDGDKKAE